MFLGSLALPTHNLLSRFTPNNKNSSQILCGKILPTVHMSTKSKHLRGLTTALYDMTSSTCSLLPNEPKTLSFLEQMNVKRYKSGQRQGRVAKDCVWCSLISAVCSRCHAVTHFLSVREVWAVLPMRCWVCHLRHMPHIHRTLPTSEVCEPAMRFLFICAPWQ